MRKNRRTRLFVAGLAALVTLNAALWLAQFGLALPGVPAIFGAAMIRAEVVTKSGGVLHEYRIDRGRITAISGRTLTVYERDGASVPIPVSLTARITINGSPAGFGALRRGMKVQTIREAENPAESVDATRTR